MLILILDITSALCSTYRDVLRKYTVFNMFNLVISVRFIPVTSKKTTYFNLSYCSVKLNGSVIKSVHCDIDFMVRWVLYKGAVIYLVA